MHNIRQFSSAFLKYYVLRHLSLQLMPFSSFAKSHTHNLVVVVVVWYYYSSHYYLVLHLQVIIKKSSLCHCTTMNKKANKQNVYYDKWSFIFSNYILIPILILPCSHTRKTGSILTLCSILSQFFMRSIPTTRSLNTNGHHSSCIEMYNLFN